MLVGLTKFVSPTLQIHDQQTPFVFIIIVLGKRYLIVILAIFCIVNKLIKISDSDTYY